VEGNREVCKPEQGLLG